MKSKFPTRAAIGLLVVWGALSLAVPLTLDLFKDFKIEMPGLTMLVIQAYHWGNLVLPVFVLATALLLRWRQSAGWMLALLLCGACDLAGVSLILPLIALANTLNGGGGSPAPSSSIIASDPGVLLAVFAVILNQILFVFLIKKRREFLVAPILDGSLLPIK